MSGLGYVSLARHTPVRSKSSGAIIKALRAYTIGSKKEEEKLGGAGDCHSQSSGHWIVDTPIANPMSMYQKYKASRLSWGSNAIGTMLREIELHNGIKGYGVTIAGEPGCFIAEKHLARFVVGEDVRNIELIWDQMWRATINYGRKGLPVQTLSAIDLALWDALGKLHNEPVYNLLGGRTKDTLPIYSTTARPDLAKKLGFVGAKVPLPYGPGDGDEGMRKNVETMQKHRESVGPDFPLMIDCYMSLNVAYTVALAHRLQGLDIKWLEECLIPDDYEGWKEVRRRTAGSNMLFTTGEHEYTRYGFRKLLETRAVDVLQPDISWVGGITEARRIIALASAYDIPVIPHGSGPYSYHLQIAYPNCPMA